LHDGKGAPAPAAHSTVVLPAEGPPVGDEEVGKMMITIPTAVRGCLSFAGYAVNTVFWCIPLFITVVAKAIIPVESWVDRCSRVLHGIAENWIWGNNLNQQLVGNTCWEVRGINSLKRSDWYLVLCNHQSWVDILVLQRVFYRRIPFLKFFIKKGLMWFPLLGQAWWAMDFPFVKRYSRRTLERKPHLRGRDLETTRKACAKFKKMPMAIMNFVEGTRFTTEKFHRQQSPYSHLLRPRAGGLALVLSSMGEQIQHILDVTIVYPEGRRSFWDLMCGKIRNIKVEVRSLPVGPELRGNYAGDVAFRDSLQQWLNNLWAEKDRRIEQMAIS
jgi:1-acyl-sn-glycerol-3-phosphate acyltransferase